MPTTRADVAAALSVHEPAVLRAILEAADVNTGDATSPTALAQRIADGLWWNYCTPAGYAVDRTSLEAIVQHVARRLKCTLPEGDVWTQLDAMTQELGRTTATRLSGEGVAFDDLDPSLHRRLGISWLPTAVAASGGASALGAKVIGGWVVGIGKTPIGQWLPYIPRIGPIWNRVAKLSGVAAVVGGPLAIALSTVAINASLGTNYQRLVPLLLGIGALRPRPVEEAHLPC